MKYFVVLSSNGYPVTMFDSDSDNDEIKMFDSFDSAWASAVENPLGKSFGFKIVEWDF